MVSFQHVITIKVTIEMFYIFLLVTKLQNHVYFILTADYSLDWPHFTCPVATRGSWPPY